MAYDIIGDIHGHADKLEALLRTLGYRDTAGAWRHPDRQAIFVGDFIDRGPAQVRSVQIVRRMVDAGVALAVMGNHELNAIAWHTPDPRRPSQYYSGVSGIGRLKSCGPTFRNSSTSAAGVRPAARPQAMMPLVLVPTMRSKPFATSMAPTRRRAEKCFENESSTLAE
jgi:hypothetical protein